MTLKLEPLLLAGFLGLTLLTACQPKKVVAPRAKSQAEIITLSADAVEDRGYPEELTDQYFRLAYNHLRAALTSLLADDQPAFLSFLGGDAALIWKERSMFESLRSEVAGLPLRGEPIIVLRAFRFQAADGFAFRGQNFQALIESNYRLPEGGEWVRHRLVVESAGLDAAGRPAAGIPEALAGGVAKPDFRIVKLRRLGPSDKPTATEAEILDNMPQATPPAATFR